MEGTAGTANNSYYFLSKIRRGWCVWILWGFCPYCVSLQTSNSEMATVTFLSTSICSHAAVHWVSHGNTATPLPQQCSSLQHLTDLLTDETALNADLSVCFLSPQKAWQIKLLGKKKHFPLGPPNPAQIPPIPTGPEPGASLPLTVGSKFPCGTVDTLPGLSLLRSAYTALHFRFSHSEGSGRFGNTRGHMATMQLLKGIERA